MMTKRINAFTIMEVTVAMLISAIIIGITYAVYNIISLSYNSFNTKNRNMAVVLRMDELLRKDFDRSGLILKDTNGVAMQRTTGIVKYKFQHDYVLRIGLVTDTFKVEVDTVSTLFENEKIDETSSTDKQNIIDGLDIQLALQNKKFNYHYHKVYSSETLFKKKINAFN